MDLTGDGSHWPKWRRELLVWKAGMNETRKQVPNLPRLSTRALWSMSTMATVSLPKEWVTVQRSGPK